jgi:hypothetical protein
MHAATSVVRDVGVPTYRKLAVCVATLLFTGSLHAHHSAALFDRSAPIRLKGIIAEVRFANPHSYFFLEVENSDGQRVRWAVENSGTLAMTRERGFDESTLQVGDPIEVCGYAPKSAYLTAQELAEKGFPRPQPWWGNWDRVITGRLLILKGGPAEHWSHYGPLEACQALLQSERWERER